MLQRYGEPQSPKEGGVFKIHGEPNWPVRERVKRYDEPVQPISPNEGACLSYRTNRNRQMRARV